jgi:uncharacterized protein YidB (DUF937 family)
MSFMNIITSFISQSTNSASTPPSVQDHASATQALMQHFSEQPGGLGALANQFRQNGMASHVDSWLSPQANQPLEPQQVEQGLGGDALQSIAQRAGVSPTVIKLALATALPLLMSHLAHGSGELPAQASEGTGLAGMAQSLFSHEL